MIHLTAKANGHSRENIAITGSRLGEHLESAEYQYQFPPKALIKLADLLS